MTPHQRDSRIKQILLLLGKSFDYSLSLTGCGFFHDDDFFTNGYIAEVRSVPTKGWGVYYKGISIGIYQSRMEAYDSLISHLTSPKIAV